MAERKPPVQCGNCGAEIKFELGQLVGDPEAIARVKRWREALRAIAAYGPGRPPDYFSREEMMGMARAALDDLKSEEGQ